MIYFLNINKATMIETVLEFIHKIGWGWTIFGIVYLIGLVLLIWSFIKAIEVDKNDPDF